MTFTRGKSKVLIGSIDGRTERMSVFEHQNRYGWRASKYSEYVKK